MRRSIAALAIFLSAFGLTVVLRSQTQVTNPAASLQGKTLAVAENSLNVTGAWQFNRGASAPFLVVPGAAKVANLDVDFLDGHPSSYYRDLSNINAGTLPVSRGGTGATTLAAHGPLLGAGTSAFIASSPGTAGQVYTSNGGGADPTFQALPAGTAQVWTLLKALSGTDTSAGATNVDTVAISGLSVRDQLEVRVTITEATQQVARFDLYSTTDSTILLPLSQTSTMGAGVTAIGPSILMADQAGTSYTGSANVNYWNGAASGTFQYALITAPATAWTGNWTLALRHGGVTAGGTFKWRWAVYKIAGT